MSHRHKKHSSDLKGCSCGMCRYGLHRGDEALYIRRASRHKVKQAIKAGRFDIVMGLQRVWLPYTD